MNDNPLEWGSHLPALFACLGATDGDVLELGVGDYSTPALHAFCLSAGRKLVSVEEDHVWREKMQQRFCCSEHVFMQCGYDEAGDCLQNREWSVVLIDNSPGGRRWRDFQRFIERSDYVVVHDFHREIEEAMKPSLELRWYHVCRDYEPPTLVSGRRAFPPKGLR